MRAATIASSERNLAKTLLRQGATTCLAVATAMVGVIGTITPNLAHAAKPTITTFACPLDNGGGRFYCFIDYVSDSSATVSWSGFGTVFNDPGHSDFFGNCTINTVLSVTVTVTNASGSTSRSSSNFLCKGGPVIL